MRKSKTFKFFGKEFFCHQMSAFDGVHLLNSTDKNPVDLLSGVFVVEDGCRTPLDSKESIDKYVFDEADVIPPSAVLIALIKLVDDFNFSFLKEWKPVKVPARFSSSSKTIKIESCNNMLASIIQDELASKRELEEYYSTEDAFQILDIMTSKAVNSALAHEEAEKKAKASANNR